VAHLWPVKADVARACSEQLYRALAGADQGKGDVARCLNEARRAILAAFEGSAEAFSPVLYLRGPDGVLFDFKGRKVTPREPGATDSVAVLHGIAGKATSGTRGEPFLWLVQRDRNRAFSGREDILKQLRARLLAQPHPVAISGLGGIGKTRTALEYCHLHRDKYRYVLWVSADSEANLVTAFSTIAERLGLPEAQDDDQRVKVSAVTRWLGATDKWLLVADNVEIVADNVESPSTLGSFLPTFFSGHVIITTRSAATGALASRITMGPLSDEAGATLLLRRSNQIGPDQDLTSASPDVQKGARELSQELGGLPLALEHVGAYMDGGSSPTETLKLYRDRDHGARRQLHRPISDSSSIDLGNGPLMTNGSGVALAKFAP
jgi:hypothetical protein